MTANGTAQREPGAVGQATGRAAESDRAGNADLDVWREAAMAIAESVVADAVRQALNEDGRSLRALQRETGLDPAFLSRLARGKNCELASLAQVALALGKGLHVSFEDLAARA